jgi:hypothetical protein
MGILTAIYGGFHVFFYGNSMGFEWELMVIHGAMMGI